MIYEDAPHPLSYRPEIPLTTQGVLLGNCCHSRDEECRKLRKLLDAGRNPYDQTIRDMVFIRSEMARKSTIDGVHG